MRILIDSHANLYPLSRLPGAMVDRIKARLTFPNPAYLEAEKRGFYTGNIPREIRGWRQEADRLTVPRGVTAQLVAILRGAAVQYHLDDRRRTLPEVDFTFCGEFRDYQEEAAAAVLLRDFGTLAAPTGSGKTVLALGLAQ